MALFTVKKQYQVPNSNNRIIIIQEQNRSSEFLQHLDRYHSQGHLPVRMKCIDMVASDQGEPMVVYACPMCNWREGYIMDRRNPRKAYRLWAGYYDGHK